MAMSSKYTCDVRLNIILLTVIWLFSARLGFCDYVPTYVKVEKRGGWIFETSSLDHGVRLNRRTWIADQAVVIYDIWIEGKHLWAVSFAHDGVFFTPVHVNCFEHIACHLDSNTKGKHILDFLTPDRSGYIASITFHQGSASVALASKEVMADRIKRFEWNHTKPYSGPRFLDPKSVYSAQMPE